MKGTNISACLICKLRLQMISAISSRQCVRAAPRGEILSTAYTAQPSSGSICAWPLTQYNEQAARSFTNTDYSSEEGMS